VRASRAPVWEGDLQAKKMLKIVFDSGMAELALSRGQSVVGIFLNEHECQRSN
jgi:hypothetical protein